MMTNVLSLILSPSVESTVLFICFTGFSGILLGKIPIGKIKFGVAGVLFSGLILGHLGAAIETHVLHFARDFGLILFVYSIGMSVGPRFFSSFREEGFKLNIFAAIVVLLGFFTALTIKSITGISPATIAGIMCGAVTNTPSLGAAQQILADQASGTAGTAAIAGMGYAIAYPFGILGIILTFIIIRRIFKVSIEEVTADYKKQISGKSRNVENVKIKISQSALSGVSIDHFNNAVANEFVISGILREKIVILPKENVILMEGDIIYGVAYPKRLDYLKNRIGEVEIIKEDEICRDNTISNVLVTNGKIAGKTVEQIGFNRLHKAVIIKITRAELEIFPAVSTKLEKGDIVRVICKADHLQEIRNELGDSISELSHHNAASVFLGIVLGVFLGSIPVAFPGFPLPVKLGLAGGTLIMAILLGHRRKLGKLDFYMTPGANMMLRELGIVIFLACVGLSSGAGFVHTLINGGYIWILYGAIITFMPLIIVAVFAMFLKYNYLKICGMIAGAMTDPPALEFANSFAPVHAQSTAYATVYPMTMFLRVLLAQILIIFSI